MRTLLISMAAVAVTAAVPVTARPDAGGRYDQPYAQRVDAPPWQAEARGVYLINDRDHDDRDDHRGPGNDHRYDQQEARDYYHGRVAAPDWQRGRYYTHDRPDPRYNGYYADNYYRSGAYYRPRPLYANDRIYRGRDNRYYCRRSDGTTGLVVGALSGGVLGNVIAPGGSKTLGSILGGSLGAILGSSIDRGHVTCR